MKTTIVELLHEKELLLKRVASLLYEFIEVRAREGHKI